MFERRAFLKLGVALGLARYAEPILAADITTNDWIEDKGDFIIIRVPDGKTMSRQTVTKPAIVLLGEQSNIESLESNNPINIAAKPGSYIGSIFTDCSKVATEERRAAIILQGRGVRIVDINAVLGPSNNSPLDFVNLHQGSINKLVVVSHRYQAPDLSHQSSFSLT